MVVELALFGASGAGDRAVGAISVRSGFHRLDASTASVFTFATEANALLHSGHALAGIATLLARFGADFTVLDAFLHRYFHLHAAYYAGTIRMSPPKYNVPALNLRHAPDACRNEALASSQSVARRSRI